MNSVKGSTSRETKMIKAVPAAPNSKADGLIGAQTLGGIAGDDGADCWPRLRPL